MFQVQRQPGTNTVEVVDSIKALFPEFRRDLPPGVNLDVVYDRSASIRESVNDVKFTLLLTVGLVVLVIFIFLRNVSATIIPSLALPLSIIGTFAAMYFLNYSLDNLSLMALTLAVGFVVDDAIVVLENIVRHMEMGKSRMAAALEGGREIAFTVLSMTLSLTAVFIPVLFMGGIVGRLFHEFAVVISVAILISGFVSLSLTPMLCSRFLRPPDREARQAVPGHRTRLRRDAGCLPLDAERRHPASVYHADDGGGDAGPHRVLLRSGAQGLHPQPGHRSDQRLDRIRPGRLLRQHGAAPAAGGARQSPPIPTWTHSFRAWAEAETTGRQCRPDADPAETARRAESHAGTDHGSTAAPERT